MKAIENPIVLPPAKSVAKFLLIDDQCNVSIKKGYTLGVNGLAVFAAEKIDSGSSAYTIAANTLRAARALPDVENRKAFNVACEAVIPLLKAASSFRNVQFLISAIDAKEALKLDDASAYDVAASLGYLKKSGLVDDSGDALKLVDADSAKSDPVFKALKTGSAKSNSLREVIKEAKVAKNEAAKKAGLPEVFNMGGRNKTVTVTTQASDGTRQEQPPQEPTIPAEKLTVDAVLRMFESAVGAWDKLMSASDSPGNDLLALNKGLSKWGLVRKAK